MCTLNRSVDFSQTSSGAVPEVDLTVVNVYDLTDRAPGSCSFDVMDVGRGGVLMNGLFIVNASIDMSSSKYSSCPMLSASLFDTFNGQI